MRLYSADKVRYLCIKKYKAPDIRSSHKRRLSFKIRSNSARSNLARVRIFFAEERMSCISGLSRDTCSMIC